MILYTDRSHKCCEKMRLLTQNKTLPPGKVLEADINEVTSTQLIEFTQCHFFCGIGGWPLSCDMAGIPQNFPIWTASLPCQPFSRAGYQRGFTDRRHLWPVFFNLVEQCRPPILVGEQVVSNTALKWWDKVARDLEGIGYAVAAIALPASSVGAYHKRDRLYWGAVANTHITNPTPERKQWSRGFCRAEKDSRFDIWDNPEWVRCSDGKARPIKPGIHPMVDGLSQRVGRLDALRGYGNAIVPQLGAVFLQEFLEVANYG